MTGHIKDHRKELQSDIWLMPPLYHRLWQYLKYKVNYEDAEIPMHDGTKFKIKRGQHLTSVRSLAQGIGWHEGLKWKEPNPKTISTVLEWLVKNSMIKIDRGKGNREYTLITLIKYEDYQERKDKGNSKGTVSGEAREQLADIKKEELRRIKEESIKHSVFGDYTENKVLIETLESFLEFRKKIKSPMTDNALKLLLTKLDKICTTDGEKIEVLNQSILQGWKGIFPLKQSTLIISQNGTSIPNYSAKDREAELLQKAIQKSKSGQVSMVDFGPRTD